MNGIVTLTTDFSTSDAYVSIMKGVILSVSRDIAIVDLAHDIGPQDISQAAFVIESAYKYFPKGTVNLVVVDPGVGSLRRRLAMRCGNYYFVGPDNGVFSFPIRNEGISECVEIPVPEQNNGLRGVTFEGRDVFAPIAAKIACGVPLSEIGSPITNPVELSTPRPRITEDTVDGRIIYIDHFGNCVSNIELSDIEHFDRDLMVTLAGVTIGTLGKCYSDVEIGGTLSLINSVDHVEIAINHGSAAEVLNVKVGSMVRVTAVG